MKSCILDIRLGSNNASAIMLYKVPNRLSVAPKINSDYHKKIPKTAKYMVKLKRSGLGLKERMVYNILSWVVNNYSFIVSDLKNIWIHVYNKIALTNKLIIVNYYIKKEMTFFLLLTMFSGFWWSSFITWLIFVDSILESLIFVPIIDCPRSPVLCSIY